jgi:hypothetical protein
VTTAQLLRKAVRQQHLDTRGALQAQDVFNNLKLSEASDVGCKVNPVMGELEPVLFWSIEALESDWFLRIVGLGHNKTSLTNQRRFCYAYLAEGFKRVADRLPQKFVWYLFFCCLFSPL